MNTFSELSRAVIAAAIEVHRLLGPGLMESVYEACLIQELTLRGFLVVQQCEVPIFYKGVRLKKKFYLDLVVNGELIIELKSVAVNHPLHAAQLLTYLRLSNLREGLVLNFGLATLHAGIQRVVNNYEPS